MKDEEKVILTAQLAVLESFIMMTLGLYLAASRNDPAYEKATALLNELRRVSTERVAHLGSSAQHEALRYADFLARQVSHNLRSLRGEGGTAH